MKKPSFRRLLALLLCAALAFSAAGCAGAPSGESVPDENQPGVSYTQLMDDMNRQVLSELSEAIPDVLWWGTAGGHVVAYGVDDSDPETPALHLLADIDPENETFTCVSLTLPQPAADIPRLAEALAAGVPDAAERPLAAGGVRAASGRPGAAGHEGSAGAVRAAEPPDRRHPGRP